MCVFSNVQLFLIPWTIAHQALLSMGRILEWLPFPFPEYLPDTGIKPKSPSFPALEGGFFTIAPPGSPCF